LNDDFLTTSAFALRHHETGAGDLAAQPVASSISHS
jgi:hypothetical protein